MVSAQDDIRSQQPSSESARTHLLVVEDEPTIRQLFVTLLEASGYSVAQAVDGFAALEEIRRQRPALILSDLNMPRMTGFELLSVIRRRFPAIHAIAMSGGFAGEEVPDGVAADAFYEKSGRSISTLVQVIEQMLDNSAEGANRTARQRRRAAVNPESSASLAPAVALWVSRRGTPIDGPHILLTCPECLRSFPQFIGAEPPMRLHEAPCIFCATPIAYALLDPALNPHPGFAPSDRGASPS